MYRGRWLIDAHAGNAAHGLFSKTLDDIATADWPFRRRDFRWKTGRASSEVFIIFTVFYRDISIINIHFAIYVFLLTSVSSYNLDKLCSVLSNVSERPLRNDSWAPILSPRVSACVGDSSYSETPLWSNDAHVGVIHPLMGANTPRLSPTANSVETFPLILPPRIQTHTHHPHHTHIHPPPPTPPQIHMTPLVILLSANIRHYVNFNFLYLPGKNEAVCKNYKQRIVGSQRTADRAERGQKREITAECQPEVQHSQEDSAGSCRSPACGSLFTSPAGPRPRYPPRLGGGIG